MIANSISTLPSFLAWFALAMAILVLFVLLYLAFTPYREIALIRQGNAAAAVSLSGTLIGFALPVANVIRNSRHLMDLAVWSTVACLVQLSVYLVARAAMPHLAEDIPAGKTAPAIFLAALSVGVGIISAACMQS